jgi:glucosamine--fructose-6-phosphate aminotransferase (isomerizing)
MCADLPEELVVTSHGSPLYIGVGDGGTFVASNPSAFKGYSRHFIKLDDREVATITVDGRNLDLTKQISSKVEEEEKSPAPYPHWYIKEVMEQPQAIGRALCFGGRLSLDTATLGGLDAKYDKLKDIDSISVVGCGSSINAALYGTKLLRHAGVFTNVAALDANSADDSDFRTLSDPKTQGLIAISQSGETKDIIDVVHIAQQRNLPVIGVVNEVGSTLANMTKCGVYTNAGQENAAPSTKSFTTQVVCMALIAMWFRQVKAKEKGLEMTRAEYALAESLQRLPITFGMLMRTQSACKKAAKKLASKEHCFVLGKGFGEPIAMEGALKLKEVGYLHAEGYSGGALKHGPFAMIESDEIGKNGATPIIMLVLDDNHAHHMRTACEEVKARGADLIIITDNKKLADGLDDDPIVIPSNGPLTALGAVVPLQMIAYELAMLKDNNPDTPRNLLKSY